MCLTSTYPHLQGLAASLQLSTLLLSAYRLLGLPTPSFGMECVIGGLKLISSFYGQHSVGTDIAATVIGTHVAGRSTGALARALLRPVVERVGVAYYKAARRLRDGCVPPLWLYTAPASICCLEDVVRARVLKRRQAVPVTFAKAQSAAKPVLAPIFDPELDCHVIYEHIHGKPKRLKIKEVDSAGNIKWEIAPSVIPRNIEHEAQGSGTDEKRIKKLETVPGWSAERIVENFKFIVIILLDGRPYGMGFRVNQDEFHAPYHMGPLEGRKLEICGVEDYLRDLDQCTKVELNPSSVRVTTLDYGGIRSKTGYDQMLIKAGRLSFARAGVSVYSQGFDKNLQGEVIALGFNMATTDTWKDLVVHRGSIENTAAFTAVTGTMFHTINTEPGWSGSPLMRMVNGTPVITGVHISAVPGPAAFNIAITAPMVEKLVRCHDNDFVITWNCSFQDMIYCVDGEDEQILYYSDEKSTAKKIATGIKRSARAKAGKAKGRQAGAPKRNRRKGTGGWNPYAKTKKGGGGTNASRMSSATYDKLKQAASLLGTGNPAHMKAVHKTYGKLMKVQDEIEEARLRLLEDPDDHDAAEEMERLERTQEAIIRNFAFDAEARMRAQLRSAPPRQAASSTLRWADMEDEDEEEEYEEPEGFYDYDPTDEALHYPNTLWYKMWSEHDPDAEARSFGNEARETKIRPEHAFSTACQDNEPWHLSQTPGIKKKVAKTLLDLPISVDGIERRSIIPVYSGKIRRPDGTDQLVVSDEFTYITRRIAAQRDRRICIFDDGVFHWFVCEPVEPGDISDIIVVHTVDRDAQFTETLPAIEISSETTKWWYDAWPKAPYTGDTGGSEKNVSGDVTTGDQKKLYEKFYRDAVSDPVEGVKPHRKLVTSYKPDNEIRDALDRFFSPAGKMSDLESAMNCDPELIWSRPEAVAFRKYCRAGGLAWTSEEGEVIRDSNDEKCFSVVGCCERLPGKDADKHYTQVTRKVKKAVKRVIQSGVSDAAKESLLESLTYVLPPGDEASMIKSLRGQSKKQRIARPSQNLRCLLKHIARSYQENYPPTEWSLDSRPLGEVLDHHLTIADDKAIGWTAFLY